MGPSIAEGNQGCSPNWADFPVAARRRPIKGKSEVSVMKRCWSSQEFELSINHAIVRMKPTSPIRL